jgi:hypothetical protein
MRYTTISPNQSIVQITSTPLASHLLLFHSSLRRVVAVFSARHHITSPPLVALAFTTWTIARLHSNLGIISTTQQDHRTFKYASRTTHTPSIICAHELPTPRTIQRHTYSLSLPTHASHTTSRCQLTNRVTSYP